MLIAAAHVISGAHLGSALNPLSLCTPKQWSLASSAAPDFFLDSLLASCGTVAPSGCVHAANPSPLPGIRPKPKPQLPVPAGPGRWADKPLGLVSAGWHLSSVRESLRFALRTPVAALSSTALKLLPSATHSFRPRRGFLVCRNLSSFTAPSQRCRSCPYSFVSVFPFCFCPTQVRGKFLAFWEVWCLLPAFSRCSVGVVPHVDVFLIYLWGGRWSPCLTPLPSWRSSLWFGFQYERRLSKLQCQWKKQMWEGVILYTPSTYKEQTNNFECMIWEDGMLILVQQLLFKRRKKNFSKDWFPALTIH